MINNEANPNELAYRRTGRILLVLVLLYVPVVGAFGFGAGKLFDSDWPLGVVAALYLACIIVFTIKRFTAYYRWTGRYPFYLLRRR